MNTAPDNREQEAPGSFNPSAALREIVADWHTPGDDEAPAETDKRPPWPDDAVGPRLTFAELVDQEALSYRAWGNAVGDFLATEMEKLAQLVRWSQATTPDEHDARMDVWNAEIRQQWEAIGYEEGKRACRCGERLQ